MPAIFFGKWSLLVTGNVGEFDQRVRVLGSLNADGTHGAPIGAQIAAIDGAAWHVWLERSADGGATWQDNVVQRIPTVTPQNGLTVTLYGDDDTVPPLDSDVAVQFVYLDPAINPHPSPPGFGFTLPPGSFRPARPLPLCECCREVPCVCPPRTVKGRRRNCCSGGLVRPAVAATAISAPANVGLARPAMPFATVVRLAKS
jgi:hypothetical protein